MNAVSTMDVDWPKAPKWTEKKSPDIKVVIGLVCAHA